jgi:hypothetical protein
LLQEGLLFRRLTNKVFAFSDKKFSRKAARLR